MKTTSYIIFTLVGLYLASVAFFIIYGSVAKFAESPRHDINLTDNPVQKQFDAEVHTIRLVSLDDEEPENGYFFASMWSFPGVWITCNDSADSTTVEYAEGWGDNIKCSYADGVLTLQISTQFFRDKYSNSLTKKPIPIKISGVHGLANIDNGLPRWGTPSIMHVTADTFNIACLSGNYFRYCNIGTVNIKSQNDKPIEGSALTFKYDTDIEKVKLEGCFTNSLRIVTDSSSVVKSLEWKQPEECKDVNYSIEGNNLMQLLVGREK